MNKDLLKQLEEEHNKMRELMSSIENEPTRKKVNELKELLVSHSRAEEKVLYAYLQMKLDSKSNHNNKIQSLLNEAYEEHAVVDGLFQELEHRKLGSDHWCSLFTVIKENLEHHMKEEESDLFEHTRNWVELSQRREFTQEYIKLKKMYQTSLPTQKQINERSLLQESRSRLSL